MNHYNDCNPYTSCKGYEVRKNECHYDYREVSHDYSERDKGRSCCKCKKCCSGPMGPRGPRGPKGEATTILGSFNSFAELIAAHPTGEAGDAYLVDGVLYVWDSAAEQWVAVGNLKGPKGEATTILGAYDNLTHLIAVHPTGEPGDAYLVGNELYVWDPATNQWKAVGNLTGPTGPTGPQGEATTILGSYDTLADLTAAHPTGEPGDAYLVSGELYVWDSATNQWKAVGNLMGPTGPTGPKGEATIILGSYDTLADLIADHATGEPGDAYLVDGVLYVWDAATAQWIAVGNLKGPKGTTNTIIPFSSGTAASINSNALGAREEVVQIGNGVHAALSSALDPITLGVLVGDSQLTFSMPDDGVITALNIFISVSAAAIYESKLTFKLYASNIPDNTFYPLNDSTIEFDIPAGAAIGSMHHQILTDLNIPVNINTRIMLIGYCETVGAALQALTAHHVTGSIKIESEN